MNPLPFSLSLILRGMLDAAINEHPAASALTLNFKDPSYSPEHGGYHPVEIRLERRKEYWALGLHNRFCLLRPPWICRAGERNRLRL